MLPKLFLCFYMLIHVPIENNMALYLYAYVFFTQMLYYYTVNSTV